MAHRITVLPKKLNIYAANDDTLLSVLRSTGLTVDAPCGGDGRCGKCRVIVDGAEMLACKTVVDRDMMVTLPHADFHSSPQDKTSTFKVPVLHEDGYLLAFDIGTTTVVGYLLNNKTELASVCLRNPQAAFGADVMSRIRLAVQGQQEALTDSIRHCLETLTHMICQQAGILPGAIKCVSVVGNPAMQQFLLDIPVDNLAKVPFSPILTQAKTIPAKDSLPLMENAELLIVPDIAGFVGADTVACVLATEMVAREEMTLLVDIGTNAEMVLGNRHRMVACSAAAGPALEGACIRFGMYGQEGAVDHIWLEKGQITCSVIGGGTARGICGSGLLDAIAVALEQKLLNERGKILTDDSLIHLTDSIYLTQEDIRQVQLAKGAIAAGIQLMASHMGIALSEIQKVYLAGAFGTYMDPKSACKIGLLPKELENKITAVGNAAGRGARILACSRDARELAQRIVSHTETLELSTLPEFPRCFAKNMRF